MSEKIITTGH